MHAYAFLALIAALVASTIADELGGYSDIGELFVKRFERSAPQRYCYCSISNKDSRLCFQDPRLSGDKNYELCPSRNQRSSAKRNRSLHRKVKKGGARAPDTQRRMLNKKPKTKGKGASSFPGQNKLRSGARTSPRRKMHTDRQRPKGRYSQNKRKTIASKKSQYKVAGNHMQFEPLKIIGRKPTRTKKNPSGTKYSRSRKTNKITYCIHPIKGCIKRSGAIIKSVDANVCAKKAAPSCGAPVLRSGMKKGKGARRNASPSRRMMKKQRFAKSQHQRDSPSASGGSETNKISTEYCIEEKKGGICILIATKNDIDKSLCEKEAQVKKVVSCQSLWEPKTKTTTRRTTKKPARTTTKGRKVPPKHRRRVKKTEKDGYQKDESENESTTPKVKTSEEKSIEVMQNKTDPKKDPATYYYEVDMDIVCTYRNPNSPNFGKCFMLDDFKEAFNNMRIETAVYGLDVVKTGNILYDLYGKVMDGTFARGTRKLKKAKELFSGMGVNIETVFMSLLGSAGKGPCTYSAERFPLRDELFKDILDDCKTLIDEMKEKKEKKTAKR